MKKFLLRRKGFTLIELLIVIVIIGILAVGFAPSLLNAPKKARDGVRKGQIAGIKQAVDAYALDKNPPYPVAAAAKCVDQIGLEDYFQGKTLPADPSNNKSDCSGGYGFYYIADAKYYAIYSKLEVAGSGNFADPAALKFDVDLSKTGDYYVVLQKL